MHRFFHSRWVGVLLGAAVVWLAWWGVGQVRQLQAEGGFDLSWWTADGGGATFSTGGGYQLGGTAGQPDAGSASGGSLALNGGFWPAAAVTATPTATHTPSPSPTPTLTLTPTTEPSPTSTATHTPGPSPTPTATHTPGPSPTPTATVIAGQRVYLPLILTAGP